MTNNAPKKSGKKAQFLLFALCSIIAMAVCMGTLVITVNNLDGSSATMVDSAATESKTKLSDKTDVLTNYIYDLTKNAVGDGFIKVNSYTDVSVDEGSVVITAPDGVSDKDNRIFNYAKNYFLPLVDALYGDDVTGVYGENTGIKPVIEFTDIEKIIGSYTQGAVDEKGANLLNDDGTIVDGDFYFVNFEIEGSYVESEVEKSTFMVTDLTAGIASIHSKIAPSCEITNTSVTPAAFRINAKVNRITDEIEYIEIQRNYIVKADYKFIDRLAAFGEKRIEFTYTVTQKFDYFYAGVDILEDQMIIDEKGEAVLTVNADIEDYSDYTVRFISSDESVATVDEMGYVTGVKSSDTPVTITVELEYLGRVFTDQCTVLVGDANSVEEVAQ